MSTRVQKPGHLVRPGDVLTLALGSTVRVVKVVALPERWASTQEARNLYENMD